MATAAADGPTRFASREPLDRGELTAAELRSLPRPSLLEEPLDVRHRRTAAALATLGIETPRDLLEHLPFRHHERARPIVALAPGEKGTVVGEIRRVSKRRSGRGKSIVEATLADETGVVKAIWFNQPWLADQLAPGARIALHGKRSKRNEFWVASYDLAAGVTADASDGMAPVYPATEGITADRVISDVLLATREEGS